MPAKKPRDVVSVSVSVSVLYQPTGKANVAPNVGPNYTLLNKSTFLQFRRWHFELLPQTVTLTD